MTQGKPKNVAASVRGRLRNLARRENEDFQLILTRYGLERLLYRLSQSVHQRVLVLKGAMLFQLWSRTPHRATRDVDFLAWGDSSAARFERIFGKTTAERARRVLMYRHLRLGALKTASIAAFSEGGNKVHVAPSIPAVVCPTKGSMIRWSMPFLSQRMSSRLIFGRVCLGKNARCTRGARSGACEDKRQTAHEVQYSRHIRCLQKKPSHAGPRPPRLRRAA